jgi:hypothetical protein
MYHQRLVELAGELDLSLECTQLKLPRGAITVVVKPCLADRHAAWMGRELAQQRLVELLGDVGVAADRGVDRWETLRRRDRRATALGIGADGQHAHHSYRRRGSDQLRVRRIARIEVGVRIDHAVLDELLGKSGASADTRAPQPA